MFLGEAKDEFVIWHKGDIRFHRNPPTTPRPASSPKGQTQAPMIEPAHTDMSPGDDGAYYDDIIGHSPTPLPKGQSIETS